MSGSIGDGSLSSYYWPIIQLFAPAIITGLAMAASGASTGVLLLLRREALLALTLPQVVVLGAAFGLRYLAFDDSAEPSPTAQWLIDHTGWPTLPGAVIAVVAALLLTAAARVRRGESAASSRSGIVLLPSLFVGAICAAVLVVAGGGNHLIDVQNRFVGADIAVDVHLAEISTTALLACGLVAALLWRRWLLMAQAPGIARIAGLRPALWDGGFLLLLATIILVGTNALGAVMVLSLLFLPAATVLPWCRRVPTAMIAATILSLLLYAGGFLLSNAEGFNWPLSHTVGGMGLTVFILSYLLSLVLTS
ncbi:metal ABC transporter permease [Humisphaera borealis]|uniref:Metal ABC transporter permease n=1 Tax=Humisphaera borealis TaxID=2807512 RepID=A0A7M2WT96_9BACT|nr:metal ABC transporter permease [Humisphaera borealis]QOV88392.1 metal ABC transporter permease [Humisphaera borealis]